jgi:hypothetical protein
LVIDPLMPAVEPTSTTEAPGDALRCRQACFNGEEDDVELVAEHEVPLLRRDLLERAEARRAGVRVEDVDATVLVSGAIDPLPDRVLVGEVDPGHPRRLLDVTADDGGSLGGEELGSDRTLSARGPRDQGDPAAQPPSGPLGQSPPLRPGVPRRRPCRDR